MLLCPLTGLVSQELAPLSVSAASVRDESSQPTVSYKIRNTSGKNIVAYVSFVETRDGSTVVEAYKRQHIAFNKSALYKAGADWSEEFSLSSLRAPNGAPLTVSAPQIDFVLFEDGTRWGPDRFRLSSRIRGEIAGVAFEHARLRDWLRRAGVEELLKDLASHRTDR